jgi:Tol biopolymer transport system component
MLVGCGADEPAEPAADPPVDEGCPDGAVRLAFTTGAGEEGGDLAALTADGEVTRLTDDGGSYGPAVSPDGARVAFSGVGDDGIVSDTTGAEGLDLYVVDADGSDLRRLVDGDEDTSPAWSPDGARVAFVRQGTHEEPDRIFVVEVDAEGAAARPLVTHDGPENDAAPAWSPDGDRLALVRGGTDLVVAAADGTGARSIHRDDAGVGRPSWSPDGDRLAFAVGRTGEVVGTVAVVDVAGRGATTVAEGVRAPWWSASGRLYGFARPPTVVDPSGAWRVAELDLGPDGDLATGRAVPAAAPVGFLYGDAGVSTPACDADAGPLTDADDVPEALTVAHPVTGEATIVLTRAQAEDLLDEILDPDLPAGTEIVSKLVLLDEPVPDLEDAAELVWVVGTDTGAPEETGGIFDAATGRFLAGSDGPDGEVWADDPDLAPP